MAVLVSNVMYSEGGLLFRVMPNSGRSSVDWGYASIDGDENLPNLELDLPWLLWDFKCILRSDFQLRFLTSFLSRDNSEVPADFRPKRYVSNSGQVCLRHYASRGLVIQKKPFPSNRCPICLLGRGCGGNYHWDDVSSSSFMWKLMFWHLDTSQEEL